MLLKHTAAIALLGYFSAANAGPFFDRDVQHMLRTVGHVYSGSPQIGIDGQKHKKDKKLTSQKVRRKLKEAGIIPSVIEDFVPTFLLNITFPQDLSPFLGHKIKPSRIPFTPNVTLYSPPEESIPDEGHHISGDKNIALPLNNLVIILTDPDAPSRQNPVRGEHCHWIAQGISLTNLSLSPPDTVSLVPLKDIVPYEPPGPPPKTGKHRYIFLAFTPKNATSFPLDLIAPKNRTRWGYDQAGSGIKHWAKEMGLLPIAADFFMSKFEE